MEHIIEIMRRFARGRDKYYTTLISNYNIFAKISTIMLLGKIPSILQRFYKY